MIGYMVATLNANVRPVTVTYHIMMDSQNSLFPNTTVQVRFHPSNVTTVYIHEIRE